MAAVTEEDLNEKRDHLEELREQLAAEGAKQAAVVQANTNQTQLEELENEERNLRAQLEAARAETQRLIGAQAPEAPPGIETQPAVTTPVIAQPVVATQVATQPEGRDRSAPPRDPDETSSDKTKK